MITNEKDYKSNRPIPMKSTAIWKNIPDFDDYIINQYGQVKNKKGRIISRAYKNGEYIVELRQNGVRGQRSIYKLLKELFFDSGE